MRQAATFRLDPAVLQAARAAAERENRSLTNFVETMLRKELGMLNKQDDVSVIAPDDVRDYELVREEGESDEHYEARRELVGAILDLGGY